jgi:uncharacterized protein YjbI with pentapeptide repeats
VNQDPPTAIKRALQFLSVTFAVSRWLPTTNAKRLIWSLRIASVIGILALISYAYDKTLWDWLKLLIVPAVIAAGGIWFNHRQQEREQQSADRRTRDDAFEAYLDDMTNLMLNHHLRSSPQEEGAEEVSAGEVDANDVHAVARVRTLTVLRRLDADRKGHVVQFLFEAGLIEGDRPILKLFSLGEAGRGADLSGANLSGAILIGANLSRVNLRGANLSKASLRRANLAMTDLGEANLSEADLHQANLSEANLSKANLSEANLSQAKLLRADLVSTDLVSADLTKADLRVATLSGADLGAADLRDARLNTADLRKASLSWAQLKGAHLNGITMEITNDEGQIIGYHDFDGADLTDAKGVTNEQLEREEVASLERATMPNGQKYEEWLKRKGRGEDRENNGAS